MRRFGLILSAGCICALPLTSSAAWTENFDSYANGSQVVGQGGWGGWAGAALNSSLVVNSQALSAPNSLQVVGLSDTVQQYSGYTSGQYIYSTSVFAPSTFTVASEAAFFILLSDYSDAGTNNHWAVQLRMTGAGNVTDDNVETVNNTISLVRNQWVTVSVTIDLTANTRVLTYNGSVVSSGIWTTGTGSTQSIGAVDLYANSPDDLTGGNTVPVFFDNMSLQPVPEPATMAALGLGCAALIRRRKRSAK